MVVVADNAAETTFFQPAARPPTQEPPPLSWNTGTGKSYAIPALEIPAFLIGLNLVDRVIYSGDKEDDKKVYSVNLSTTWEHLREQNWVFDKDPFDVNQFAHPYQGAVMYGLARSAGLSFWESLLYSNMGSFIWKMAGETDPPSINDQITTGNAGSLLGEALYRMANLVLRDGNDTLHEASAALISPATAFNRHVFGDRFKTLYPDHDPAVFWRLRMGLSLDTNKDNLGTTAEILRHDATVDFSMIYGLPGKPGYTYRRPMDYFDFLFQLRARSSNPVGNVVLRGLLFGERYELGNDYRGIWGLYGSYDYISPELFRVSTMALSLGSTAQYWVAPGIALQGSVLAGVGFGAAGQTPTVSGERDYHYGVTPLASASLRLIFGDRTLCYLSGNEYYVSGTGSDDSEGSELIFRGNIGFTVRVYKRHGFGLQYVFSSREAKYGSHPSMHESEGSISITYSYLGASKFGAVEWR
ncbi:DUF3943 domain-containing protein [Geomonas sp. RF6]|uniref:DUF3943 domain-containing protein n=1 Tax=Geomonas sp. RF6 TaxID=2897342 RepID=UPI001E2CEB6D|nr:DUF3943 domain-containing protein [Geomonas sp. RF6]UFS68779.1 DUF3943 domain-containing protein [Geomonas sp. RF6]